MTKPLSVSARPQTHMAVLIALSLTHLLNDMLQSLIPAIYPIIKEAHGLDFAQIGVITFTFQIAASLLQPAVGHFTDQRPMPYSTVAGMTFTLIGLLILGYATSYAMILVAAGLIGIGSSIFHPEATRLVRYASGGRQGLAQGLFQVGGQFGGALGPLLAALIIVPRGQASIAWFAAAALIAMMLMIWTAGRYLDIRKAFAAARAAAGPVTNAHSPTVVFFGLATLMVLLFSKNAYSESFRSFYTFYLIDRFGLSIPMSQLMLFVFLISAAAGALLGGIIGDRVGRRRVIWFSILGPLPLTLLLPHVDLFWTGPLTVVINLIMASAFASIMIYAMELAPNRIGLIGGLFYGLSFGASAIAAAILGSLADRMGIEALYQACAFLPLAGLLAWFLPPIDEKRRGA